MVMNPTRLKDYRPEALGYGDLLPPEQTLRAAGLLSVALELDRRAAFYREAVDYVRD